MSGEWGAAISASISCSFILVPLWTLRMGCGYAVPAEGQSHGVGTLRSPHYPQVTTLPDGTRVVRCPECERDREASVPIGIGTPVSTSRMAQLLCDNHSGDPLRRFPGFGSSAGRGPDPQPSRHSPDVGIRHDPR